MKTINNYRVKNKKVLLRVDLNVPVIDGNVTDRSRILSIKPTIEKLLKNNNKIFLVSHFGRPKGKYDKQFSLEFNMTNSELINHAFSKKVSIVRTHLKMQE